MAQQSSASAHTFTQNDGPSAPCDARWRISFTDTLIASTSSPRGATHPCTSSKYAKQPEFARPRIRRLHIDAARSLARLAA